VRAAFLLLALALAACQRAAPGHASLGDAAAPTGSASAAAPVPTAAVRAPLPEAVASDSVTISRRTALVEAAARVAPAVVSVNVVKREREQPENPWDFFFMPRGTERVVQGLGSGFIVSRDGVVITNQHVTSGADSIVVTMRDGRTFPATLRGEDPLTDIAVVKIDAPDLPTAPLGKSTDLMIGEWVIAIGNPFGYLLGNSEPSVTAGVVSAVGRNLLPNSDQPGVYVHMIQTDASINPGNSGGPLVNALGQVVGVNSSIFSNTGGSIGIGFAIPIERALRVADELARYGAVRRAWLGLDVAGSEALSAWRSLGGIRVTRVAAGGPAARAGVAVGDVLVAADDAALRTFLDWEAVKLDVEPGDPLAVRLRHAGQLRSVTLKVDELPTSRAEKVAVLGDMQLVTITPAVQQERGVKSARGALIYRIGQETQDATGLEPGDVIIQINREHVSSAEETRRAFRNAAGRTPVRVYFERGGQLGYSDFYVR
jgi:serine protease Do